MFSGFILLKAETPLPIWPGLEKGREAQKYDGKTVHENFQLKKNATHSLIPNLLPPIIIAPPPPFIWNEREKLFLPDKHHQNLIYITGSDAPPVLTNTFWKYFWRTTVPFVGAVPEQEGLGLRAAFFSAHFKLYQGMGDFARKGDLMSILHNEHDQTFLIFFCPALKMHTLC